MWMRKFEGFVLNREDIKEEFGRLRDCFLGKLETKIVDSGVAPVYLLRSIYFLQTTLCSVFAKAIILTIWKLDHVR